MVVLGRGCDGCGDDDDDERIKTMTETLTTKLRAIAIIMGLDIIDNNKLQLSHVFSEREKLFKCFM